MLKFQVCLWILFSASIAAECPNDWEQFENSCYHTYPTNTYQKAVDKCFWLLNAKKYDFFNKKNRPYLAKVETLEEFNFLTDLMKNNSIKEMFIGANNIFKRTNRLAWQHLNIATAIDPRLLCPQIYVDDTQFFCGFIKDKTGLQISDQVQLDPNSVANNFCINSTGCYNDELPYICEVDCSKHQEECSTWTKVSNLENAANIVTETVVAVTTAMYDPCIHNECVNEGTCVSDSGSDLNYTCNCIVGYEGQFCEQDERPCLPHRSKCKNNSTCNQFYNSRIYNCTCPDGFEGTHCELNIDDCIEGACQNGAQCEDLINDFRCVCTSFFSGEFCEVKNAELQMKENVSRSFSVLAILFIVLTYAFFISLDTLKFVFKIEPESLSRERNTRKKKKLMKKIMEDMKDKKKRRQYRKLIQSVYNQKDPFIAKIEKTFHIAYDIDLDWIDTESAKLKCANV